MQKLLIFGFYFCKTIDWILFSHFLSTSSISFDMKQYLHSILWFCMTNMCKLQVYASRLIRKQRVNKLQLFVNLSALFSVCFFFRTFRCWFDIGSFILSKCLYTWAEFQCTSLSLSVHMRAWQIIKQTLHLARRNNKKKWITTTTVKHYAHWQ